MTTKLAKLNNPIVIAQIGTNKVIRSQSPRTYKWYLMLPCTGFDDHSCLHLKTIKRYKSITHNNHLVEITDKNITELETARFNARTGN
jgi:hypothetical protein